MAREKKAYRDNLALLTAAFPGVGTISLDQAAAWYGKSKWTLKRDVTFPRDAHNRVSLPDFARWLSS